MQIDFAAPLGSVATDSNDPPVTMADDPTWASITSRAWASDGTRQPTGISEEARRRRPLVSET